MSNWVKEINVDAFVRDELNKLGLEINKDYHEQAATEYLKEALKGSSKTENKTGVGSPDFSVEKYAIPVLIEDKLSHKKLINQNEKDGIKSDDTSVRNYAVNGALHYARGGRLHLKNTKK